MGTWTALAQQPTFPVGTMLLLTDGTVMCQSGGSKSWWRLTPDLSGSYINGTWSQLADMHNSRLYYASAVLRDGRVFVAGGEYSDAGSDTDTAEIYDPATNAWTSIGNPGWGEIGDAAACLLADGRILAGNLVDSRTAIYDPATNSWSSTGNMAARSNEETWTLLPDGSVVTVSCANHPHAERYIPSTGAWISAGQTPVELVQSSSIEIGPALLLPDGLVFCVGATGHTALYTPPGNSTGTGSWSAGPDFPADGQGRLLKAKDAPGALLPNGRVLCVAGPAADGANDWPSPTMFFEFDGANLTRIADPPNADQVIYQGRMLLLPTGEVLYGAQTAALYAYQPDPGGDPSWAPTIASVPTSLGLDGTYTLTGTQLNGLSQAVSYGDDAQMATNYPLVRVVGTYSGKVRYLKTVNHSTMAVATGPALVSTQFTVPNDLDLGPYQLSVVANGIASAPVAITVGLGSGRAQYVVVDTWTPSQDGALWAYVNGAWRGRLISQGELVGIAQDLFAADAVDVWWDSNGLVTARGWQSPH